MSSKVLVINSGSSSLKYRLFAVENGEARHLAQGLIERIGLSGARIKCDCTCDHDEDCATRLLNGKGNLEIPTHRAAIDALCTILLGPHCGVLTDISELAGIGHRVVHGAEEFSASVIIDKAVISGISKCARLAPLHNPPALMGIKACAEAFEGIPQVAVFDTAFHSSLPVEAYTFPIPHRFYEKYGVRKYGFHGTSHRYVSGEAIRLLGLPAEETRIITCHLGNGCSIAAVKGGKSVDTSMGLTPLGGVMMGTRPGDLDPYIPLFMLKELEMTPEEVDATLNKQSGLKGICDLSDVRDIEKRAANGEAECQLALDMIAYRVACFIGSYAMVMGGVHGIVFTAGIGENNPAMRTRVLRNAGYLGLSVDEERNARNETFISTDDSKVKVMVIPTNEELVIARDTARLVGQLSEAKQPALTE